MPLKFRTKQKHAGGAQRAGLFAGIILTLFSLIFLLVGLLITFQAASQQAWEKVPCQVERFEIHDHPDKGGPFEADILYRYTWQGRSHTGTRLSTNDSSWQYYEDVVEIRESLRADEVTCRVNPANPAESALTLDQSGWMGLLFVVLGGTFVAIGLGIVIHAIRQPKATKAPSSLSRRASGNKESPLMLLVFFGIFALAGGGVLMGFVMPMWVKYFQARSWEGTPAEVIWSRVRVSSGSDSTTYSPDIFYQYNFRGIPGRSNTRGLLKGSSSGYAAKKAIVDAHPPGREIICYVNPRKPWQAVLERNIGWWALFTLFPLPFLAIGVGGLWFQARKALLKTKVSAKLRQPTPGHFAGNPFTSEAAGTDPMVLTPGKKRRSQFFAAFLATLFWNGIVSIFVTVIVKSWQRNDPEWILTLFMIPFVLVGLALVAGSFYTFGQLFTPQPVISLSSAEPALGRPLTLRWSIQKGSTHRLRSLRIYLIGEEIATYQRGSSRATDRQIFHEELLAESSNLLDMRDGSATVTLPARTSPSWQTTHNAVEWTLRVRGDVPFWPDIRDDHTLTLRAPDPQV